MTSILKSDNTKNGIILKEVAKKFEEATSTSGCDLEMSEITSSMPNSLSLINVDTCSDIVTNPLKLVPDDSIDKENVKYPKVTDEVHLEIEDVIDGFSVFSFVSEDDLIKFSIKTEKIEAITESDSNKSKKIAKSKKQNKFNKATKELTCTEDGIDIYDFQGNSESSPSSKNSSVNFKKTLSKKFSTKYIKKFKHKFKPESNLSPSEENSSSTSVTESTNHLLGADGRNESPRPTSNDDNNVVSTTTPDNVNIKMEKAELQAASLRSPLKTASLKLYKLEDELSSSSQSGPVENRSEVLDNNQPIVAFYSTGSDNGKVYSNNQSQEPCIDEKYQPKIIPTKFSVDLLTKITDKPLIIEDSIKCLSNSSTTNFDWSSTRKSPSVESSGSVHTPSNSGSKQIAFDSAVASCTSRNSSSSKMMTSTTVKPLLVGNGCLSAASYKEGSVNSNSSSGDMGRTLLTNENPQSVTEDDNNNNEKMASKSSTNSPMQSWLELHTKGLLFQQHNAPANANVQSHSNPVAMPLKPASSSSFNPLNSSSYSHHSNNISTKSQHDPALLDWKNNYFDGSKLLGNSVPKFSQNLNSLSHELANNIRYQQEQQELMNALRIKHENSKIPKPLVHMGLDSLYKVDQSSYKNSESRFQTPNVHNYFMPNSQLPTEFNTANVFKNRSDPRCHQNSVDSTSGKDSFTKTMSSLSASNFKTPETVKRRGQWCDMHVKIAYFIYRSQRRMSMLKSQELNSQLSHLMYSQKMPPTSPVLPASPYPSSSYLQHSSPYLDYRTNQIKPEPGYMSYQSKSSNAFLNPPIRPINPYHSIIPQSSAIDTDILQDHHMNPEQKWLRLLNLYMTNHPLSSVDRPNPDILNQLYLWYQQLSQSGGNTSNPMSHFPSQAPPQQQSSAMDPNAAYLRKYMEQFACLGSMKSADSGANYGNPSVTERDIQMYMLKQQQQYQKALMSKYQSAAINKNHINPLLMNTTNPFYNKKLMEMKAANSEPMLSQYSDCVQSLVNQKSRANHDQVRQMKHQLQQQESAYTEPHHQRNGFVKVPESSNPKRRKMNSESVGKADPMSNGACDKEEGKSLTDLTVDYLVMSTNNNNNNNTNSLENKVPSKSRENINFHLQTVIPDAKE